MEKRKNKRIDKKIKSEVHSEYSMTYSTSIDLSTGGIFISTPDPLANGTEVMISFKTPDNETIEISGVVKWASDTDEKTGMGIEFVNIPENVRKHVIKMNE
jgi:uncharacterized protein (TIGR02266 family)